MNTESAHTQHILSVVYDRKKFIERFIGLTKYEWCFARAKYHGKCRMPVPFNDFDAVICGVLAVQPMSFFDLGHAIGLNVNDNKAAEYLLQQAIYDLKGRKVLDCNDTIYELTDYGKHCQQLQTKPDIVERDFELIFNATGEQINNAHKMFVNRPAESTYDRHSESIRNIKNNLSSVEGVAAQQTPHIHCPERDIQLIQIDPPQVSFYSTSFVVAILHNCRNNTLRALVFDENSDIPIETLSNAISEDRSELKEVVEQIKKEGVYNLDLDNSEYPSWRMDYGWGGYDKLKEQQQKRDNDLANDQLRYDEAIRTNEEQAALIRSQIIQNKRYFDAIEFEKELQRVFATTRGEIWIVSPWLKKAALRLLPLIENYLKNGGKVFVCYSKSESYNDQMADEKVLDTFRQLQNQYTYLYVAQSDHPFHVKHLFLRNVKQPVHYTGSYNILSFNATLREYDYSGRSKDIEKGYSIRQETMVKLDWTEETENTFYSYHQIFAYAYQDKAENELFPLAERIYQMARQAYRDYRYKLSSGRSSHDRYNGCIERDIFYSDYTYLFADFQRDPKLFVPSDERKGLIKQLRAHEFDYLKPFNREDCEEIIAFRDKILDLLLDMDKLEKCAS